jgi:flagellar hook-associated protein 2
LAVNQSKLDSVMASNFSDIAGLFASAGKATDSLVGFNNATSATKPGNYAVNITQIATQGTLAGSVTANTTITSGVNDALSFTVNGITAAVTLTAGSYTAQTLAAELQSKLNGVTELSSAGVTVTVSQNAGKLNITSNNYGSSSSVVSTGGIGAADLLGTPPSTTGKDVAGTLGGVLGSGSGQVLSAVNGDPVGLSILVNGGVLGDRGTLNFSNGYATLLNTWSTSFLASDGALATATNGINSTIKDIGKRRTDIQARLVAIEAGYRAQFTALDGLLSSMNQTSIYLTQQLARL